jgi:hypothetical protein
MENYRLFMRSNQHRSWRLAGVFLALLVIIAATGIFFAIPAIIIRRPDPPQAVAAILHTAVGARSTADDYVISLYRQGYSKRIVCVSSQISHELFPADFTKRNLIERGIPETAVTSLHLPIMECPAMTMDYIADFCQREGWKSVMIVSSPEGNPRAGAAMRLEFQRRGIGLIRTHSPEDAAALQSRWWLTHWKIQRVIGAIMETVLDTIYGDCRQTNVG